MPSWHAHSVLVLAVLAATSLDAQRRGNSPCETLVALTGVPGLREGSALARGRLAPRFFTFNDSGAPELVVLDERGTALGRVVVRGATVEDWEDVTSAQCASGPCLFISDVGDNQHVRPSIVLYQVPEPRDGQQEVLAQRFEVAYPDGPQDAEAVFAGPDGRLYLLTKQARGAGLYALPRTMASDRLNRLQHVRSLSSGTGRDAFARITDAESTPDGRQVAVRSNDTLFVIATEDLLAGRLAGSAVFSLRSLNEPQGEGVAFGANGDVFLLGESGGRRDAGTFARIACRRPTP